MQTSTSPVRAPQPVQHGLAQPAIRGPHHDLHPRLWAAPHQLDRAVAAVVVHDREVEAEPFGPCHRGEPVDQVGKVLGFLEGRHDDADARHGPGAYFARRLRAVISTAISSGRGFSKSRRIRPSSVSDTLPGIEELVR